MFPADKRFPASLVTDPIAKQQLELDLSPVSVWPENFVPPQVDGNADLAAGELITSGSGSPADAVQALGARAREVEEPASGRVHELREVGRRRLNRRGSHESTRRRRRRRRVLWPYLYALPAVGAMAFAFGYPLVQVVRDSFYAGNFASPIWVGLDNYKGVIDGPGVPPVAAEQPEAAAGGAGDARARSRDRARAQRPHPRRAPVPGDRLPARTCCRRPRSASRSRSCSRRTACSTRRCATPTWERSRRTGSATRTWRSSRSAAS